MARSALEVDYVSVFYRCVTSMRGLRLARVRRTGGIEVGEKALSFPRGSIPWGRRVAGATAIRKSNAVENDCVFKSLPLYYLDARLAARVWTESGAAKRAKKHFRFREVVFPSRTGPCKVSRSRDRQRNAGASTLLYRSMVPRWELFLRDPGQSCRSKNFRRKSRSERVRESHRTCLRGGRALRNRPRSSAARVRSGTARGLALPPSAAGRTPLRGVGASEGG
jgi:hypothetical protein